MVYELTESASKGWRALHGTYWIASVIQGIPFVDGIKQAESTA